MGAHENPSVDGSGQGGEHVGPAASGGGLLVRVEPGRAQSLDHDTTRVKPAGSARPTPRARLRTQGPDQSLVRLKGRQGRTIPAAVAPGTAPGRRAQASP